MASMKTKANTKYEYMIRNDIAFEAGPNQERFVVVKADAKTSEPEQIYNVLRTPRRSAKPPYSAADFELHCSCPAYKSVCKHHHMVNAFRLARAKIDTTGKTNAKVAAGIFNPSDNSLKLVYELPSDDEE
jgi:hypothetical protein